MADREITEFLRGVVGAVEANSFEKLCLWQQYNGELKRPWVQRCDGLHETVGYIAGLPVCISLTTAEVDGHKILFFDPTSRAVDHVLIEKWLADNLPPTAFRDGDTRRGVNKTDAMNFCNVLPRSSVAAA